MTKVGAAITVLPGQTNAQAIESYENITGRLLNVRRCYDGAPASDIANSAAKHDLGKRKSILSIKPTLSTSLATLESLAASIVNAAHSCDIIIYHEPVDNMSGSDFINLYLRSCQPFRDKNIPVGVCYTNWSVNLEYSDSQSALEHYWPGNDIVDFIAIDEYPASASGTPDYTPLSERTRRVTQFADTRGKPLSLTEFGIRSGWDTRKSETWIRSVTDWASWRALEGAPLRDICYFHSDVGAGTGNSWWLNNKAEYVDALRDMYDLVGG